MAATIEAFTRTFPPATPDLTPFAPAAWCRPCAGAICSSTPARVVVHDPAVSDWLMTNLPEAAYPTERVVLTIGRDEGRGSKEWRTYAVGVVVRRNRAGCCMVVRTLGAWPGLVSKVVEGWARRPTAVVVRVVEGGEAAFERARLEAWVAVADDAEVSERDGVLHRGSGTLVIENEHGY